MTSKPRNTLLSRHIAAWRQQKQLPQILVARRAGIAPSYLSRIEHGRVSPNLRTAREIAGALRISLDELTVDPLELRGLHRCPISVGGGCIVDLLDTDPPKGPRREGERYTPRQVRLLRRFAALLQQSSTKMLTAIEVLIGEMLGEEKAKKLEPRD